MPYPGSFDPVTLGHYDIIERTAKMVDKLIIGVLNNKAKCPLFSAQERVNMLKEVTSSLPNVEIQSFEGLLIDFVRRSHADIVVRGLRVVSEIEYHILRPPVRRKFNLIGFNYRGPEQFTYWAIQIMMLEHDCREIITAATL